MLVLFSGSELLFFIPNQTVSGIFCNYFKILVPGGIPNLKKSEDVVNPEI